MYAIIDYAGRQVRVEQGQEVKFPLLAGEPGATITMERVLLLSDNGATHIGQPLVSGASIDATILSHGRERKVIVFKFKRRKGYRKKAGHRQDFTILRINAINTTKSKPPAQAKAAEKATPAKGEATIKAAAPATAKTAAKKAGPKKAADKSKAPRKAAAKKAAPKKVTAGAKKTSAPTKKTPAKKSKSVAGTGGKKSSGK